MRQELEAILNIKAYDIYGLSEIAGPGVAFECPAQQGMHINEDFSIPKLSTLIQKFFLTENLESWFYLHRQGSIAFNSLPYPRYL